MFKIEKKGAFGNNSLKTIYSTIDEIDFDPPYQRYGNVWPDDKRQLLLDSILNGYDIPKFYLHYITDFDNEINKSGKSYAIIDGKQRLQTIKDFIENNLKLSKDFVYEKKPELDLKNCSYKDLAHDFPDVKYDLDSYELDIVYVITDETERIEELFYRLNEGKPLNSAEKRNRIVGYLNNEIRRIIQSNDFFLDRFIYTNKRLQYSDTCLKLILTEFQNELVTFSQKTLDEFVKSNRNDSPKLLEAIGNVETNLEKLNSIFQPNDSLLKSRSLIPVYYYFITRFDTSIDKTRPFLERFNNIRKENREQKESNPILNEFDRQNQQGTHQRKSLVLRETVLEKFYIKFIEGGIDWNTRVPVDDLEIEIDFE